MNTLKDFWTELDNRISSPLFASFIISWLVCNWRIPIALIFIKQNELGPGYYSYFDLIEKQATLLSFTFPASIALIYTFGYPHLKEVITLYLSEKDIAVNEKLILHTADTNIPIKKFTEIQAELHKTQVDLATFYREESQINVTVDALNTEKKDLENKIEDERLNHQISIQELTDKYNKATIAMHTKNAEDMESVRAIAHQENHSHLLKKVELDNTIQSLREDLSTTQIERDDMKDKLLNNDLDHEQDVAKLKRDFESTISELNRKKSLSDDVYETDIFRLKEEISTAQDSNKILAQELSDLSHVYNIEETQRMNLDIEVADLKGQIANFATMKHMAESALKSAFSLEKDVLKYVDDVDKDQVHYIFLLRRSEILETQIFDF